MRVEHDNVHSLYIVALAVMDMVSSRRRVWDIDISAILLLVLWLGLERRRHILVGRVSVSLVTEDLYVQVQVGRDTFLAV